MRAIWSAPPPGPAGMMNSTGLVGSQAAKAGETPEAPRANAVEINAPFNFIFMNAPPRKVKHQYYFGFLLLCMDFYTNQSTIT
jgi:hypothetical protein